MQINLDNLFEKDAFKNIEPERLELFKQFAEQIDGKGTPEIIRLFAQLNKNISKSRPISKQERQAMASAISESLPKEDRGKFQSLLRIVDMMS